MKRIFCSLLFLLSLVLTACGDATPTPSTANQQETTAAASPAPATSVRATTAAPATATAATTQAATTAQNITQAATSAATTAAASPSQLIIGLDEITDSLDPARGFTTSIIFRATYDTLVTFPDKDASQIVPRLATKWTISDDGKIYTFTLRDDVVFSNGQPMTADDVVFSVRRLQNIKGNPAFLADPIKEVKAVDAHTVSFTLTASNPAFLAMLANTALSITNSKLIKENGGVDNDTAAKSDGAEKYLNSHSAGTGPYILESWEKQVKTVLVRNPKYWGKPAFFDRIIMTSIPAAAARKDALDSGKIDMALDLGADQMATLESDSRMGIYRGPSEIIHFLAMNQDPKIGGPVANPQVQLAIRYALDYDGYRTLWKGSITPGSNMMVGLAGSYGQDKAIKRDLNRAKDLLKEAGYPNGFNITLDYPTTTYGGVNFNTNAQKLKADLAEVGINVKLNPGEFNVALENYRNGKQGFGYWLWGPNILDPSDLLSFLPGGAAGNRVNWAEATADKEILNLRDKANTEINQDARLKLYAQVQDYLQQKGPWAPFNQPSVQTAFRADIKGYTWHPAWQLDVALLSRSK